jgi:hypothetical protein
MEFSSPTPDSVGDVVQLGEQKLGCFRRPPQSGKSFWLPICANLENLDQTTQCCELYTGLNSAFCKTGNDCEWSENKCVKSWERVQDEQTSQYYWTNGQDSKWENALYWCYAAKKELYWAYDTAYVFSRTKKPTGQEEVNFTSCPE